jgi:hypothetical protein
VLCQNVINCFHVVFVLNNANDFQGFHISTLTHCVHFWKPKVLIRTTEFTGTRGSVVDWALCYKPEGRGIEFR